MVRVLDKKTRAIHKLRHRNKVHERMTVEYRNLEYSVRKVAKGNTLMYLARRRRVAVHHKKSTVLGPLHIDNKACVLLLVKQPRTTSVSDR